MDTSIRITVLAENGVGGAGLMAEHGLSLWIEVRGRRVLFDTGQGLVLEHNARQLGIDLAEADDLVLSHGHYDHTGGLPCLLERLSGTRVCFHPAAFQRKFHLIDTGEVRDVGAPLADPSMIEEHAGEAVFSTDTVELSPGVWVTGPIPRATEFEDTGGRFFEDEACTSPDPLIDDQALVIRMEDGRVLLILGCAHAGVVNSLEYAARLAGSETVYGVLGGMHLVNASAERIEWSLDAMERWGCERIGPCHCTGIDAVALMKTRWPDRFVHLRTGSAITF